MFKLIEAKYGKNSGILRQLSVLMQENDSMRMLASFDNSKKSSSSVLKTFNRSPSNKIEHKNFLEHNKDNLNNEIASKDRKEKI